MEITSSRHKGEVQVFANLKVASPVTSVKTSRVRHIILLITICSACKLNLLSGNKWLTMAETLECNQQIKKTCATTQLHMQQSVILLTP